jgi:hypothetical protein
MRDAYNRKDKKEETPANREDKAEEEEDIDETININLVDDEALTEAVLKRVVERLLRARRK